MHYKLVKTRRNICFSGIHTQYTKFSTLREVLRMEYTIEKRNPEVSCDKNLHWSRFKTTLYFLRLGGIPLNFTSQSKLYTLYYTVIVVCYYSTFICAFMDVYVHRHDLMQTLKKTNIFLVMSLCAWMHLSLRYATS